MIKPVFSSARRFLFVSYYTSFGVLLLSTFRSEGITRLDVAFQDVRAMELRAFFLDGICIEEVGVEFLEGLRSKPADTIQEGHRVYRLTSGDWVGYVVGGPVSLYEECDPAKISQNSPLLPEGIDD